MSCVFIAHCCSNQTHHVVAIYIVLCTNAAVLCVVIWPSVKQNLGNCIGVIQRNDNCSGCEELLGRENAVC